MQQHECLVQKPYRLVPDFCVAAECICHENYKQKIIKAKDIDSEVTGRSNGHPIRCLRNQMSREYLRLEKEGAGFEELERLTVGSLRNAVYSTVMLRMELLWLARLQA